MIEVFRSVYLEGSKTSYKVNDKGDIFKISCNKQGVLKLKRLKLTQSKDGRFRVNLKNVKGKILTKYVHSIVVDSYVGEVKQNEYIKHVDGDLGNNNLSNLKIECKYNIYSNDRNNKISESLKNNKKLNEDYYSNLPVYRHTFKRFCKTYDLDFKDFEETFVEIGNNYTKKYVYKLKCKGGTK